jgi:hypothetical protein
MSSRDDFSVEALRKLVAACSRACVIGCTVRDIEMRFRIVNSAEALMVGATPEEHVGKTSSEMLGPVAIAVETLLCRVIAQGSPISSSVAGRLPRRNVEGEWIVRYVPVKDIFGRVKMIASLCVEVSAQRKIEQALSLLDQQKLIVPEMRDWATQLRESLALFDFAMHQTLTEVTTPLRDPELLPQRVRMLDHRVSVIKSLLSVQAHWIADAHSGANWLN